MASAALEKNLKRFMDADIDLLVDTIKCRIGRVSAYTFSQTHEFASDLPSAIVTDVTLGSKTTTLGVLDAADGVFAIVPAGAALDFCAFYKDTGNPATSPYFLYLDGFTINPNGGDITLQWAAASPNIWRIAP